MNTPTTNTTERKRGEKFSTGIYEKCLARYMIARQMIRLGQVQQAASYLQSFDDEVSAYADHSLRRQSRQPYGIRCLVRYVLLEIRSLTNKPTNGERWEMDKRYYLNQITKFGW